MALFQITIPKDDIWRVIEAIGQINLAHFLDMNKTVQNATELKYTLQIKRCDETERKILYLLNKCKEYKIFIRKPASVDVFRNNINAIESEKKKGRDLLFDAIEEEVNKNEAFIKEQIQAICDMQEGITKLEDYQKVISFIREMVPALQGAIPANAARDEENARQADQDILQFVAGTIKEQEKERMKRMLFRATRGMALTHFNDYVQNGEAKCAYLVMFSGIGKYRERIQKICDTFMGQRFEIPDLTTLENVINENEGEINKSQEIYNMSLNMLKQYLYDMNSTLNENNVEDVSTLEIYKWFVAKEKSIYNFANHLKDRDATYVGFLWAPNDQESTIKYALNEFPTTEFNRWKYEDVSGLVPPTYLKSNEVIFVHQMMVDMYNVPTYKELNPAVFSIVTFPYLFSVMYGDWGHGAIMLFAAIAIVLGDAGIRSNPSMKMLSMLRYMFLLIGILSVYHGLIYNEFFAVSNDFFGSCYRSVTNEAGQLPYKHQDSDCVYPFGMDPGWALTPNQKLNFMNTNKEKLSVIISFAHLNIGIICKLLNSIYFGRWKVLIFDVITGFTIFFGIIGVMITLIYIKWWYPVDAYFDSSVYDTSPGSNDGVNVLCNSDTDFTTGPTVCTSPSVITVTINNFMQALGTSTLPNNYWMAGQQTFANIFVVAALIMIPVMLCCIPCIAGCCPGKKHTHADEFEGVEPHGNDEEQKLVDGGAVEPGVKEFEELLNGEKREGGAHGEGSFSDVFVWQMVETIEFVLGTISCTASYLRLWALSLAHGQLGEVFMKMAFIQVPTMLVSECTIDTPGYPDCPPGWSELNGWPTGALIPYFFVMGFGYMAATFFVLLGMDVLEVFLHTLRLHWVEFMKQFFDGKGYKYTPFSFNAVFEKEMDRSD